MSSIKNKIPIIAILILISIVLIFTVRDLLYEKQLVNLFEFIINRQMLTRILLLYSILLVFIIILIYSYMTRRSGIMSLYGDLFESSTEGNLRYFKCPNCNGIFTIKNSRASKYKSLVTCPTCKITGRLTSKLKSGY